MVKSIQGISFCISISTVFFQELDLPFIKLSATEIVAGVSGESEEKLRGLFSSAIVRISNLLLFRF